MKNANCEAAEVSRFDRHAQPRTQWIVCNMYGPPPNCNKNQARREQSAKMHPASAWEMNPRALDDDPRVPVLLSSRKPPSQTWRTFLGNHLTQMVSIDRRVDGTVNCARPFPATNSRRYLLRDRDAIFGDEFREQVRDMGIHEVLSTPRSPWQRAYVERVIGSIRHECLDHEVVFNAMSLRRILASYFAYYHRARTHLSLGKDSPEPRLIEPREMGRVVALPQVGGLHHRYQRSAA